MSQCVSMSFVVEVEVPCFKHMKCGSYEYIKHEVSKSPPSPQAKGTWKSFCSKNSLKSMHTPDLNPTQTQRILWRILELCLQIEPETLKGNHLKPSSALFFSDPNWDLGATLKSKNGLVGHLPQLSSIMAWVSKRETIYTPTSANTTVSLFPPSVKL